jgi:CubicO group peptidase (beta-lactamase class C family)
MSEKVILNMLIPKLSYIYSYISSLVVLLLLSVCTYANTNKLLVASIHKEFNIICNKQKFSGAMLIAIDGNIIFKQACGIANRSFNVPNNIDTKFNLGSVGKLFTSVAIAQLIQQKKILLSASLYQVLPSWISDENARLISIEQLLIHTAGLGNFMNDKRWQLGADSGLYVNIKDYKPLIKENKLLFNPGKSQSYSNDGYILLGAIIESISHKSYQNYLEENIFIPSGMKNTGIYRLDEPTINRAEGYISVCKQNKCDWKNNNFEAPFVGSPAGGAYSTIDDLFKFSQALHHNKLLNPEFTREILSPEIISLPRGLAVKPFKIDNMIIPEIVSHYGFAGAWNKYGFAVWTKPFLVGHTGGIAGASAFFATSPDNAYTIIILSNTSGSAPIYLYEKIRGLLGFQGNVMNY